ncbi:MAG: M48 family metalloprotease, partial [Crenarchaeota archaeon]|nr:M48 family metalloprotease [Thermoproteota archaeon]
MGRQAIEGTPEPPGGPGPEGVAEAVGGAAAVEPLLLAGLMLALLGEPLAYLSLLRSRDVGEAAARARLLMLASVAAAALYSLGLGSVAPVALAAAAPLLVAVQGLLGRLYDRRTVAVGVAVTATGERLGFRVIDSSRATAFTLAAGGRVYASARLVQLLDPDELAAVVAHEYGHLRGLAPLPAWAAVLALVASLSWLLQGALEAPPAEAVGALAVAAAAWMGFNWGWEHLADVVSLEAAGAP